MKEQRIDAEKHDSLDWRYPDGGLRAWLVVLGCFMYATTIMAYGLTWGVFQDYYHTNMFPNTSLSILSLAGGLQNFLMNFTAYLSGGLGDRYGYKVRSSRFHSRARLIALSSFLAYLCLLASAFTTKLFHVFLFQGVFLGISHGLSMPLYMSLPSQWFLKKRGLATGLAVSGAGIGGGIQSLVVRKLLVKVGFRNTLLIYSSMHGVVWIVALCLIKERRSPDQVQQKKRWIPERVDGRLYSVATSVFVGIFGFLAPFYFSTTYTKQFVPSIAHDPLKPVVPLVLMNFSGTLRFVFLIYDVASCIITNLIHSYSWIRLAGKLADYLGPMNVFFSSFFFGGLFQILIWTFAKTYAAIIVFSILSGLVGCWFISLLPVVCAELFGVEGLSTITGLMILANSPGQLAGAPIAGAIFSASGGSWVAVTMYSGGAMVLGSLCILYGELVRTSSIPDV
ncbi:major facilitator superfamily domain-containing protein [Desarmillaria tabescens]|uniref:Major facilitator superfamily domain-containing protein n=1 Tax=Armillaria tabescens TaxID=1929756 RepID=A0AA39MR61_ARMTA|nr:major facilitator superfamily domain-containing protein [Desarmillaria tabescens]KAK0442805.1 major facilitator superfamily domain-containing protein [Desarmillaria tabescens]